MSGQAANPAPADGGNPAGMADRQQRSMLIVDSDRLQLARLRRYFEERHFCVQAAETLAEATREITAWAPDCVIIEPHLPDGSGLELLALLQRQRPTTRSVILTGYGNIANAVAAIKRGAVDYLAKPGDFEEIQAILTGSDIERPLAEARPMSADRVRWEHIQRIYEQSGRNVSETARRLNMHRRTLQRILAKRAPR